MDAPVQLPEIELEQRATACVQSRFPGAMFTAVAELQGGASSLTYIGWLRDAPVDTAVIKVAPVGHEAVGNRDVLRQARLLAALSDTGVVPVPIVFGTDAGHSPKSPPLFVMSHVEGDSHEPITGSGGPSPGPKAVEQRGFTAARLLAGLHSRDHQTCDLAGEPVYTLHDELDRWTRALATCAGDLHPAAIDEVEALLRASIPVAVPPAITHGDYRLGNMLSAGSEIRAIIDWEIWSIGDPRIDLGWFLTMSDPRRPDATGVATGMPTPDQLAAAYRAVQPRPVRDLGWFTALARFKEVAVLSLIIKHERRSSSAQNRERSFLERIPRLIEMAVETLEHGDVWEP